MNGLIASTRAELLRVRKWPATWVTVGAWLFLTALFGYLFSYVSYKTGDTGFSDEGSTSAELLARILPAQLPDVLIQGTPMFGGALMMVLGAIVAGNGYGWGTWKTVFIQGPSRISATAGSLVAVTTVVTLVVVVATLALCVAISTGIALVESQAVVWPSAPAVLESMGAGFLVLEMWALLGFLLGTVAKGPALSVGLGLVWALVIENLLRGVGALLGFVDAFTTVLPGTAAGSLVGSVVGADGLDGTPGVLDVLTGAQASGTVVAYLVLLPLLTVLVVRRRDVA